MDTLTADQQLAKIEELDSYEDYLWKLKDRFSGFSHGGKISEEEKEDAYLELKDFISAGSPDFELNSKEHLIMLWELFGDMVPEENLGFATEQTVEDDYATFFSKVLTNDYNKSMALAYESSLQRILSEVCKGSFSSEVNENEVFAKIQEKFRLIKDYRVSNPGNKRDPILFKTLLLEADLPNEVRMSNFYRMVIFHYLNTEVSEVEFLNVINLGPQKYIWQLMDLIESYPIPKHFDEGDYNFHMQEEALWLVSSLVVALSSKGKLDRETQIFMTGKITRSITHLLNCTDDRIIQIGQKLLRYLEEKKLINDVKYNSIIRIAETNRRNKEKRAKYSPSILNPVQNRIAAA